MPTRRSTLDQPSRLATSEDVRHVLGELEDVVVAEILAAKPTYRELTEAAIRVRGDAGVAHEHKELSAGALAVAEILRREEEEIVEEGD